MTQHNKDFFELFKENSYKLAEQPTPRTWKRLERRLDAHKRQNRYHINWTLGMVAAVLGLVVLVGLLSVTFDSKFDQVLAQQDAGPRYLEELASSGSEEDLNPITVIEYQRHYEEKTSQIQEGSPERKLKPAPIIGFTD